MTLGPYEKIFHFVVLDGSLAMDRLYLHVKRSTWSGLSGESRLFSRCITIVEHSNSESVVVDSVHVDGASRRCVATVYQKSRGEVRRSRAVSRVASHRCKAISGRASTPGLQERGPQGRRGEGARVQISEDTVRIEERERLESSH